MSHSPEETEKIGEIIFENHKDKRVFAFFGNLGAGKTAMTRGIARAAKSIDQVSRPTYTIVNDSRGERTLAHFDMSRISHEEGLYEIGCVAYLTRVSLCVVEWVE